MTTIADELVLVAVGFVRAHLHLIWFAFLVDRRWIADTAAHQQRIVFVQSGEAGVAGTLACLSGRGVSRTLSVTERVAFDAGECWRVFDDFGDFGVW